MVPGIGKVRSMTRLYIGAGAWAKATPGTAAGAKDNATMIAARLHMTALPWLTIGPAHHRAAMLSA
jgi:hypothetical protein